MPGPQAVVLPPGGRYDLTVAPPGDWKDRGMIDGVQVYVLEGPAPLGLVTAKDAAGRTIFTARDLPPGTRVTIGDARIDVVPPSR